MYRNSRSNSFVDWIGWKFLFLVWSVVIILSPSLVFAAEVTEHNTLRVANFDRSDYFVPQTAPGYLLLMEDNKLFKMPHHGRSDLPRLVNIRTQNNFRSLRLSIGPSDAGQTDNDRSEFTIVGQGDQSALHLDQDRYLGFTIIFDSVDFQAPTAEIIVCQIWQSFEHTPTGPPAFISMIKNNNELAFRLATRDDKGTKSHEVLLSNNKFIPNAKNFVVLHVLPRAEHSINGLGEIEMWLNGDYVGGSKRVWGYDNPDAKDEFDVRVGLYANPEPIKHTVYVGDIRWGTSKQAVDEFAIK